MKKPIRAGGEDNRRASSRTQKKPRVAPEIGTARRVLQGMDFLRQHGTPADWAALRATIEPILQRMLAQRRKNNPESVPRIRYAEGGTIHQGIASDGTRYKTPKAIGTSYVAAVSWVDSARIMAGALRNNAALFDRIASEAGAFPRAQFAVAREIAWAMVLPELEGTDFSTVRALALPTLGRFEVGSWRLVASNLAPRFVLYADKLCVRFDDRSATGERLGEAMRCAEIARGYEAVRVEALNGKLTAAEARTLDSWEAAVEKVLAREKRLAGADEAGA